MFSLLAKGGESKFKYLILDWWLSRQENHNSKRNIFFFFLLGSGLFVACFSKRLSKLHCK